MYKQFDIVAVNYPFSDNPQQSKLRPAIIISNALSNELDSDVLLCPISTQIRSEVFSYSLDGVYLTFPLPAKSEIRCNKITTLRTSLIIKKISSLKQEKHEEVLDLVIKALK
jgi:mRNA interferase MazF